MKAFLRPIVADVIGGHMHRSGWPFVLKSIEPLFDPTAKLVFDDFLEKTICNQREGLQTYVHSEPWVGVCHYPYDTPTWYETEHLRDLENYDSWAESLNNLRLCVTLGENLASWIRAHWGVPCSSIKHPTEIPNIKWSPDKFLKNKEPLLLQVGWYLRNTNAIYQVDAPPFLVKAWLRSRRPIAESNHILCGSHFAPKRLIKGVVLEIELVDNVNYDILLSENIIFIELITSVANNTIIECIARNTPIILNRHPGPEYYLGEKYPLFFSDFDEIKDILTIDRILAAHDYLKNLEKKWLDGSTFCKSLIAECTKHYPSIAYCA